MEIAVSSELADFAGVWPKLDQPGPHRAYVFQTRDVLEVWLETIGAARSTRPVLIRVSQPDGTPLMLLPLGLEQRHGMRILGFLDGGVSDYNAPVLFPGAKRLTPDAMRRLWADILARLPRFDAAILDKIPATVEEMENPFQILAPAADVNSGHLILLRGADRASGTSTAPRFSDTDRKWRKLKAAAKVRFLIASTPSDTARMFEEMIRQKTRRYIETRGLDGFDRPGYRAYYRAMTERFSVSGAVQLSVLLANDVPIATHWGIVTRNRFYYLMPAFAANGWARYSPGLLHLEQMIAWSHGRGMPIFDLGAGDESYKLRIANAKLALFRAQYAGTPRGRTYLAARAVRRKIGEGSIGEAWRAFKRRGIHRRAT